MDTIVNPLKIVGRAVAPENIVDGLGRKFRSVSCNIMCNKVLGFGCGMVIGFTTTYAISAYHHRRCVLKLAQVRCTRYNIM